MRENYKCKFYPIFVIDLLPLGEYWSLVRHIPKGRGTASEYVVQLVSFAFDLLEKLVT